MNEIVQSRLVRQIVRDIVSAVMDAPKGYDLSVSVGHSMVNVYQYCDGNGRMLSAEELNAINPIARIWIQKPGEKFDAIEFSNEAEILLDRLHRMMPQVAA